MQAENVSKSKASVTAGEARRSADFSPQQLSNPPPAKNLYSPHSLFTLLRTKVRARALGSERAPEGESPSLAVLPARQLKVTASRQRDVESNWK